MMAWRRAGDGGRRRQRRAAENAQLDEMPVLSHYMHKLLSPENVTLIENVYKPSEIAPSYNIEEEHGI